MNPLKTVLTVSLVLLFTAACGPESSFENVGNDHYSSGPGSLGDSDSAVTLSARAVAFKSRIIDLLRQKIGTPAPYDSNLDFSDDGILNIQDVLMFTAYNQISQSDAELIRGHIMQAIQVVMGGNTSDASYIPELDIDGSGYISSFDSTLARLSLDELRSAK